MMDFQKFLIGSVIFFFIFLFLGIKCGHRRAIPVRRLIILPTVVIVFFVNMLFGLDDIQIAFLGSSIGLLIGIILGFINASYRKVCVDKKKRLIEVPGDWSILFLLMGIFFVGMFIFYVKKNLFIFSKDPLFILLASLLTGFFAGANIGRSSCYFYKYLREKHIDAKDSSDIFNGRNNNQ